MSLEWKLEAASYVCEREHATVTVETEDGISWSVMVTRSHPGGMLPFLRAKIAGLRDKSVAINVGDDLYKLAKTCLPTDCAKSGLTAKREVVTGIDAQTGVPVTTTRRGG